MKNKVFPYLFVCIILAACGRKEQQEIRIPEVDSYVKEMMSAHQIPGISIAVIKDDSVLHRGFYGKQNLETNESVDDKTLFKVFSLTKTFVSVAVFKLIEEDKLSLTDKISNYFTDLPANWKDVTISNLLSHSSGLPDIRQLNEELSDDSISEKEFIKLLYNDKMEFNTGESWNYNQTNYILLKMLIEKLSGENFEEFVINHQFKQTQKSRVTFSCNPKDSISNLASYYSYNTESEKFDRKKEFSGIKNHPLAGLVLTLDEYIEWNRNLDNNELISESTKQAMWTPFKFTNSGREFLHGWDVYKVKDIDSYGFSGGGVSGFRKFPNRNLTIVVLATGNKYYSIHDIMIEQISGIIDASLKDEESFLIEETMRQHFLDKSKEPIELIVKQIKEQNPDKNLEEVIKSIGFTTFFQFDRKERAIELFEVNVREYPDSYDTYGSLAYLYFLTQQYEKAKINYTKAFELNPENTYSERRIKEIDEILNE